MKNCKYSCCCRAPAFFVVVSGADIVIVEELHQIFHLMFACSVNVIRISEDKIRLEKIKYIVQNGSISLCVNTSKTKRID